MIFDLPSWIFRSWKFPLPVQFGGPICVFLPNFAKIGLTVLEIWPIFDFQDGGRPLSWIFKSCEFLLPVHFRGPLCVITQNFAKIGRTTPEMWPIFDFQDGGRPPSWICFTRVGTTQEEYLVIFVTVQNSVVIGAVISIGCKF